MRRIEEDNGDICREFTRDIRSGEGDCGFSEPDLVVYLRRRRRWIGRRKGDAERKEREIEDGDVERRRGEDECDILIGEGRMEGLEGG